ncbi:MAG: ATP-dependent DNA helicase [Clostridia bacterium]|nr:ATP-dependent DNA helicase [Clostridia bacterium]
MQLKIDRSAHTAQMDADALASFARVKPGVDRAAGFHKSIDALSDDSAETPGVRTSVPAAVTWEVDGWQVQIGAAADIVSFDGRTLSCEMRRTVRRNPAFCAPGDDVVFLARAMLTAYMLAENEGCESIALRIGFVKGDAFSVWESMFARAVLRRSFEALTGRAEYFVRSELNRLGEGRSALAKLRFPYPHIREGQRDLVEEMFRCIRRGQRLLASAPTGIGKTMSAVYPSLLAMGREHADRIFYFTAKTVTGNAALDAVRELAEQAPLLRCIRLTAKDRLCPRRKAGDNPPGRCRRCPNCAPLDGRSYEERRDGALRVLLEKGCVLDSADILSAAADAGICPYELSLDASEYCDMIVCDYGYLLDPAVQLQRYFQRDRGERYVFLFDEAHNLPDRARSIWSETLSKAAFQSFADAVLQVYPEETELRNGCQLMLDTFSMVEKLCAQNEEMEDGESRGGYFLSTALPSALLMEAARFSEICGEYLRRSYEANAPLFEDMRQSLRKFCRAAQRADEAFTFYSESGNGEVRCRILCLDPASLLDEAFAKARCTSLFSATLSPMEYYAHVCGCEDAVQLELPSPYEGENLCLVTVDSLSTRQSDRKKTAADVAEMIFTITESRIGNYILYFSSYKYMTEVCRRYLRLQPSMPVILQKQGMELEERARFLREFEKGERTGRGVVAFCVLGGLFSEGIDLRGEKLIGSVIVGIGLPGVSSELNILAEYYERTRESGRDYAYLYPAMNKILQAAGRVIRSEEDRGVVVLIDDRYADPDIRRMFPSHWNRMQYTGDAYSLSAILERFWEEHE